MTDRLAKLADLKAHIGTTETSADALLLRMIEVATHRAERAIGRPVCRQQDIIEYPCDLAFPMPRTLRLSRFPVESIASIKQAYAATTAEGFDQMEALVEYEEWVSLAVLGHAASRGRIHRVHGSWMLHPRHLQVVYTAGYADPARIDVSLDAATYDASERRLTQAGAFADYEPGYGTAAMGGDVIVITGGTGVTPGAYLIADKVDDDTIKLAEPLAHEDLETGDITSLGRGGIDPPRDLQEGVVLDALQLWQYRQTGGVSDVSLGGGGSISARELAIHPVLMEAAQPLRVIEV